MWPQDNNGGPPEDDSRLGRGLESLIPPSRPHAVPEDKKANAVPAASPAPAVEPAPVQAPAARPDPQPAAFAQKEAASPRQQPREEPREKKERSQPQAIYQIEVDKISSNPDQPRRVFDEQGIRDLAASIREFGLLQPIVVTKKVIEGRDGADVEYILISGERRLMASRLLGLERIPAIIRNVSLERERLELAIIENIQREQLNAIETARAMARLQDEFRLTQREIAVRLGKSREVIANAVRLLDLPPAIQKAIEEGKITESHGRLLLAVPEPALQEKLFRDLVERGMTTRELRRRVQDAKPRQQKLDEPAELSPELKMLQEKLSQELGAPVAINRSGETGKITITFYSEEELKHIAEKIGGAEEQL